MQHKCYHRDQQLAHLWVGMGMVVMVCLGFGMKVLPHGWHVGHKLLGLVVLVAVGARLVVRSSYPMPQSPRVPVGVWRLHNTVHALLYLAMVVMPLSGWVMASAAGKAPALWGWVMAFPGVPRSSAWAHVAKSFHNTTTWVLVVAWIVHLGGIIMDRRVFGVNRLPRMLAGYRVLRK